MQEKLLINMKLKQICFAQTLSVILLAGMSACSKDPGLDNPDPNPSTTTLWIDGEADPNQTWMTSVSMQLDLSVKGEGMLTAQTIGDNVPVVLGKKQVHDNDVMLIDVPQGIGSFGLVFDNGSVSKQYQCIRLSGDLHQLEKVSFDGTSTQALSRQMAPAARAATNTGLYGSSILSDEGYLNFGSWAWNDIAIALVEDRDASKKHTALIDYEIMARGSITAGGEYTNVEDVYVSFIYGYTGTTSSSILGYYTHSAGSYSDIEYHDISEVITKDYLNGKAKVQYQLDGNTTWYDANFDYKDGEGLPNITSSQAAVAARRGDDAYNTLLVSQAYGDRITAVRGLTFKINVPKGKVFGFYLKTTGPLSNDQRTRLTNHGVPEDRMPTNHVNFSYAPLNANGKHRSAFAIYDNFTFMGLHDAPNSNADLDCNDVTFVLSNAKGGQYRPQFTDGTLESDKNQETIKDNPIYTTPGETGTENLQSWILAFENAGTDVDFDFNDVVLQVVPNTTEHTVAVYLLATGAERNTYIYYGNQLLGEAHQLFGVDSANMVNTKLNGLRRNKVRLSPDQPLSWPEDYTMDAKRHLFSIKIPKENGDTTTINSNIMLGEKLDIPQVLCVSGKWNWPLEHQNVAQAYTLLGPWGRNVNNPEFWNWYSDPKSKYVFDYWK